MSKTQRLKHKTFQKVLSFSARMVTISDIIYFEACDKETRSSLLGTKIGHSAGLRSYMSLCLYPSYLSCPYDKISDKKQIMGSELMVAHIFEEYSLLATAVGWFMVSTRRQGREKQAQSSSVFLPCFLFHSV